ncbi:porin family protein [uncultured Kordia sp.]|uniref:porin family protein n=1 Tax=uncultured Kordia sp. TaxID=507699 RepID=UPI002606B973|nr:porin family protein [uncultured Kordia sp.]
MKKTTILIVLLCIGFTTNAQEKFSFGVKAGGNLSTVSGTNTGSDITSPRVGFHVGVMSELSLSNKFSLQGELVYSQQGVKQDALVSIAPSLIQEVESRYDYLNVPILAKYYLTNNWSVEAGPQLGILLSAKRDIAGAEVNVRSSLEYVDLSAAIGTSYKFNNGLNLSARYNFGLTNLNGTSGVSATNYNSVFQLSVGYFFK